MGGILVHFSEKKDIDIRLAHFASCGGQYSVKMHNTALLLLPLLFGSFALYAQPKKPPSKPEDPELYFAFFKAHTDTDVKIQSSNAAAAASLSTSTAALYHIAAADLPQLSAEVRKFNVNLGAWYLQQQYYLAQQKAAKKTAGHEGPGEQPMATPAAGNERARRHSPRADQTQLGRPLHLYQW